VDTEERRQARAVVDAFILEYVEAGLIEVVGVDERGRVVYRGTGKPFLDHWPNPPRPRGSS
jgi:hypothetical protein